MLEKKSRPKQKTTTIICIEFVSKFGTVNNLLSQLEFIHRYYPQRINMVVIGSRDSILIDIQKKLGVPYYALDFVALDDSRINLLMRLVKYLKTLFNCWLIAIRHKPSVIYCSHYGWSIYGNPLGFILNKPVIVHLKDVFLLQPKLARVLMKFNPRTLFIAVSRHVFDLFSKVYKVNPKQMVIIQDGVDSNLYSQTSRSEIMAKVETKKKIIGMFSRIEPERDVEMFIDCAYLISKNYPNAYFEHHGYAKNYFDEQYVRSLKNRVEKLNLTAKFKFVPFYPRREKVAMAYKRCFLTVVTARQFALPNVAIESMMCGTPVIAFRTGGNGEVIKDKKNGSLVPYHSAAFFAREIENYLKNEKDYLSYTQEAMRDSRFYFDGRKKFTQLIEFYLKVAAS